MSVNSSFFDLLSFYLHYVRVMAVIVCKHAYDLLTYTHQLRSKRTLGFFRCSLAVVELFVRGSSGMYYNHTYFCRKAALLCSGLKGFGTGEITGT